MYIKKINSGHGFTPHQRLHLVIQALLLLLLSAVLWVQVMKPAMGTQKQIGEVMHCDAMATAQ